MAQDNPYKSPVPTESQGVTLRTKVALWWLIYLYPFITLALIHASWTLTVLSLGRPPGFGEHPSNDAAHTAVHLLASSAAVSLLAGIALVPLGAIWSVTQPFARPHLADVTLVVQIACLCVYVLMLLMFICIWEYDPTGAIYWFVD